jgi:hypothetical protein
MDLMDDDVKEGCFLLTGVTAIYVVIALVLLGGSLIGYLINHQVYTVPLENKAFNSQVQGLVTEYCTAPQAADEQAARSQLSNLVAGDQADFNNLPSALKQKAQAVVNDDVKGACP